VTSRQRKLHSYIWFSNNTLVTHVSKCVLHEKTCFLKFQEENTFIYFT
jgi:hypothetical protein